jgi:1,4-dihydroxy-2-naphthoate octaprenyltransferase
MVKIALCSNSNDVGGDTVAGRRTTAVTLGANGNRIYVAAWFVLEWGLTAWCLAAGYLPWLAAALLAPCYAVQVGQLWRGPVATDWLRARRLGFLALRVGALGLVLSNVLGAS